MTGIKRESRKLTINYTFLQCLYNMSYCCVINYASVFLLAKGFSNSQIGTTLMLAGVLAIVSQPIIASAADKAKKTELKIFICAVVGVTAILSGLLFFLPTGILPIGIIYVLLFCSVQIQPAMITSLSLEYINVGIPLNFSLARGIGSFAFAVLALGMGFFVNALGASSIMPVSFFISGAFIFLAMRFKRPEGAKEHNNENTEKSASGLIKFVAENKRFMVVILSIVLLFLSHAMINTYTIQIVKNVGGNEADMGAASAIGGLVELPAMALFPLLLKKLKSAGIILKISAVAFVVKAIATLLAPNVMWIYAAQCIQFFGFGLYIPAIVYYTNRLIDGADKTKGQAFSGMALAISAMVGNITGGFLLDMAGGVELMLTVGIAVSVVGLIILFIAAPRDREEGQINSRVTQ